MNPNRPYLIIPKLIVQPTWGGFYIPDFKGWQKLPFLANVKIGQSYELFSGSKLAVSIYDTSDTRFLPELGNPDTPDTDPTVFSLIYGKDFITMEDFLKESNGQTMPLLIKFTQSLGNSFQIHIKYGATDNRWKPKAESWYYFEPGFLTYGIKKGINVDEYKDTCLRIEAFIKDISNQVKAGSKDVEMARSEVAKFINTNDPHKFVNLYESHKYETVDLSGGGIHHSWEEDMNRFPLGNVLYEVQEDVMDPVSTIRSFDQGKIKNDGSVREIHIEDYFKYVDLSEDHNDVLKNNPKSIGETVLATPIYSMDVINVTSERKISLDGSFNHVFVRDGVVEIESNNIKLKVGKGFSCFVPAGVNNFIVRPLAHDSVILKTYLTK